MLPLELAAPLDVAPPLEVVPPLEPAVPELELPLPVACPLEPPLPDPPLLLDGPPPLLELSPPLLPDELQAPLSATANPRAQMLGNADRPPRPDETTDDRRLGATGSRTIVFSLVFRATTE
jgi:hypothetical protein